MNRASDDIVVQFRAAIAAVGLTPPAAVVADGGLHRFATSTRAGDDAGWYVLHAGHVPAGAFGDWRTGLSLTWRAGRTGRVVKRPREGQSRLPVGIEDDKRRTAAALTLWQAAMPARNTLVEKYLASRGLSLPPGAALRFHEALPHPSGGVWSVMVALVTSGHEDVPLAVRRTFLARDDGGGKAPVKPCRMMLGPCRGGAVLLAPAGDVTLIGEGTAAMQASGLSAWLSTSGLRTLELPVELHDVIVLADGDLAGEAAAESAARRWKRQGRRVRTARAPQGMDFNDMLQGRVPRTEGRVA